MLQILPIKSIREEDLPVIGKNNLNLAYLTQHDFPVADGVIVCPPEFKLHSYVKHFRSFAGAHSHMELETFEQSIKIIHSEMVNVAPPEELIRLLTSKKMDSKVLWKHLLDLWVQEIKSKLWREGFSPKLTQNLTAHPVLFISKIKVSGRSYYSPADENVHHEIDHGILSEYQQKNLEHLIKKANKKVFIPQIYHWIVDTDLKITRVVPYTQDNKKPEITSVEEIKTKIVNTEPFVKIPTGLKIFIELSENPNIHNANDGIFIHTEKILNTEQVIQKVSEITHVHPLNPIILKLPDIVNGSEDLRGSLHLIHNATLLKNQAEAFLFLRNKKQILNLQIAVPFVRGSHEFSQIKRDLAAHGITRKGSLKMWLEFAVPENLTSVKDYIDIGFDGALINLDTLASLLGGFSPHPDLSANHNLTNYAYKNHYQSLILLMDDFLKTLHREKITILFTGDLALYDEFINLAIQKGVWGVVINSLYSPNATMHIAFLEKKHAEKRFAPVSLQ